MNDPRSAAISGKCFSVAWVAAALLIAACGASASVPDSSSSPTDPSSPDGATDGGALGDGASGGPSPGGGGIFVEQIAKFGDNVEPAAWNPVTHQVIYNRLGADGLWDAYSANPDGSEEACLTCALPSFPVVGAATNRGANDISPDGKYIMLSVEKGAHPGKVGDSATASGRGVYNDLWLLASDASAAWPLTNLPVDGDVGTIWQRFDRTGNTIVWSQMYKASDLQHVLGQWSLMVADIVWTNGAPSLANTRSFMPEPGRFYEPYGFSPDNKKILFASDVTMPGYWATKIWTVNIDFTNLTRITPVDSTAFFADYDEFAYYIPGSDLLLFGRTYEGAGGSMDYWTMASDGSNLRRLTFLGESWNPQSQGFALVGGLAFDPRNPNQVFAGIATDHTSNNLRGLMMTMAPYGPRQGLTGEYFSDAALTVPVTSRVDPSIQFKWTTAPVSGAPATGFAIRWTGTLTPPAGGSYGFCAWTDHGVRLWIDGTPLINEWDGPPGQHCASMVLAPGKTYALRMDYLNGGGTALAELAWTPPGGTLATIPPTALRP